MTNERPSSRRHLAAARKAGTHRFTSSEEWYRYYSDNARHESEIPWHLGPDASRAELAPIMRSLQAWQLGETSDGSHLRRAAAEYVERTGDHRFLQVADLFIKEEQRHGEMLGRFIDIAGEERIHKDWGDSLFRLVRYSLGTMESWATPVIMVETMALVYYRAIHDATPSRVLRAICSRILYDEVAHIRFQYERLAIINAARSPLERKMVMLLQRMLFTGICILVWAGHRRVFRAGGHTFFSYWRNAWRKMRRGWACMEPERYQERSPDTRKAARLTRTANSSVVPL